MAYIEFQIIDKTFIDMDPSLRSAELERRRLEAEEQAKSNSWSSAAQQITKFPRWLRDLIKEVAAKFHGNVKWCVDNDTYGVRIRGDLNDAGDFCDDFASAFDKKRNNDKDILEWSNKNPVRMFPSESDGDAEMADLENHSRGARKEPEPIKDEEEEAVAEAMGTDNGEESEIEGV